MKRFLITIKGLKKPLHLHQKLIKKNQNQKKEESIAERLKLRRQKSEEKEFNNFLEEIKQEQKSINIICFKNDFDYGNPDKMLQTLHSLPADSYNHATFSIEDDFNNFSNVVMNMLKGYEKSEGIKILNIVDNIFNFISKERKQRRQGLKKLTPNQMLGRLPISLAQLKAGNNFEKLKNEIRQLLYSLYRSKKLTKQLYKSLIDII